MTYRFGEYLEEAGIDTREIEKTFLRKCKGLDDIAASKTFNEEGKAEATDYLEALVSTYEDESRNIEERLDNRIMDLRKFILLNNVLQERIVDRETERNESCEEEVKLLLRCVVEVGLMTETILGNSIGDLELLKKPSKQTYLAIFNLYFKGFESDLEKLKDARVLTETEEGFDWRYNKQSLAQYFGFRAKDKSVKWQYVEGLFTVREKPVKNLKSCFSNNGNAYKSKFSKDYEEILKILGQDNDSQI